ncbi:CatB-related O-acetyltransferase [Saccharicrinis aurantiacus]|uniref:CatB-related O-acetyltransferase n=1 Tax=Saccharicrinis aurantiacus TaxID=1849719 RepID=UPI00248FA72F|nr:CatB-related O-acetyltransferase [Saccharicrinis aurantiacus]
MYSPTIRKIFKQCHGIEIGYGSYGGCFNTSNIRPNIKIGNYCSIASKVDFLRANHPIKDFTMHPIAHRTSHNYTLTKDRFYWENLVIGNDVWIGQNVVILPSCKSIGNGAVIGAGSIVTKNIEPYSIVAGNPAKKIKMRFTPKVIKKLEDSKWWTMDKDELIRNHTALQKLTSSNEG